jgi:hypothetical protein
MHGEDCLVQMFTEGIDEGRRFFKCQRALVIAITLYGFNILLFYTTTNERCNLLQSSLSEGNYGFTRWVDPRPIYPHAQYIYYL